MKKEELRKVKIELSVFAINDPDSNKNKTKTFEGYFHQWIKETFSGDDGLHINNFGLVELKDGRMKRVDPEKIQFISKENTSNISYE